MTLHVLDTTTGTKRAFRPVRTDRVGLYVCGMTVQDRPHVGHMFAFVACDMIRRYLEYLGFTVLHVQNFTDVDDKIIQRSREEAVDWREIAERNIARFHEAATALLIRPAHHYPRVTEHIPEITVFVERLIASGHAYAAEGDVYFRVRSWEDYGRLSGRNVDEMRSGVRIEVGARKEDPLDFALWKSAEAGDPGWDSPWGKGRPGWHIECSVMSTRYLGDHFDFHGGGRDLLFPHHENEVAQSCCVTGQPFVNFWLHNGLINLGGRKMSKSDGNFFGMDEILGRHRPEAVRFFLLNAHFRSQLDFSENRLREAAAAHARLVRGVRRLLAVLTERPGEDGNGARRPVPRGLRSLPGEALQRAVEEQRRRFFAALDDDFNSGGAIGALFALIRELNQYFAVVGDRPLDPEPLAAAREVIETADGILGLCPEGTEAHAAGPGEVPEAILGLVAEREEARAARNWARADALRADILDRGFRITDTPEGPRVQPVASPETTATPTD